MTLDEPPNSVSNAGTVIFKQKDPIGIFLFIPAIFT